MHAGKGQRLKEIGKEIVILQIIGAVGPILVGLALYGIWGADGNAFHPLLDDTKATYIMLAIGISVMVWEFSKLFPLLIERRQLMLNSDK